MAKKPATESHCAQGSAEYAKVSELSANPPQGLAPPLSPVSLLVITPAPSPRF